MLDVNFLNELLSIWLQGTGEGSVIPAQVSNIHYNFQPAFKVAHSTESVLLKMQNNILWTVDYGGGMILILLDLSAKFNTIHNTIHLNRLHDQLGIGGETHALFESHLKLPDTCRV